MVLLGLHPRVLLDRVEPSTEAVLDRIEAITTFSVPEPGRATDVFASESGEE
jgi:hypothetical protein